MYQRSKLQQQFYSEFNKNLPYFSNLILQWFHNFYIQFYLHFPFQRVYLNFFDNNLISNLVTIL